MCFGYWGQYVCVFCFHSYLLYYSRYYTLTKDTTKNTPHPIIDESMPSNNMCNLYKNEVCVYVCNVLESQDNNNLLHHLNSDKAPKMAIKKMTIYCKPHSFQLR